MACFVGQVSKVYDATDDIDYCRHVHSLLFVECDCAFGPEARRFRCVTSRQ
jgi:hypothetical protein